MKKKKEEISSKISEKKHIHSLISNQSYQTLKKLSLKYGNISKVLEEAIQLIEIKEAFTNEEIMQNIEKKSLDNYKLSHLMLRDFNMMIVGRQTFLSYIDTIPETPMKDNNAMELIEWYFENTSIYNLNLFEILSAIKGLWMAGNYFRKIQIESLNDQIPEISFELKMIFSHDFNRKYGNYWSEYFSSLLKREPINCSIHREVRNQSFYLLIQKEKVLKIK